MTKLRASRSLWNLAAMSGSMASPLLCGSFEGPPRTIRPSCGPCRGIPLFDPPVSLEDGSAAWQDAEFDLRFRVRFEGQVSLTVRLDFYRFDDTDPTIDPVSVVLGGGGR